MEETEATPAAAPQSNLVPPFSRRREGAEGGACRTGWADEVKKIVPIPVYIVGCRVAVRLAVGTIGEAQAIGVAHTHCLLRSRRETRFRRRGSRRDAHEMSEGGRVRKKNRVERKVGGPLS